MAIPTGGNSPQTNYTHDAKLYPYETKLGAKLEKHKSVGAVEHHLTEFFKSIGKIFSDLKLSFKPEMERLAAKQVKISNESGKTSNLKWKKAELEEKLKEIEKTLTKISNKNTDNSFSSTDSIDSNNVNEENDDYTTSSDSIDGDDIDNNENEHDEIDNANDKQVDKKKLLKEKAELKNQLRYIDSKLKKLEILKEERTKELAQIESSLNESINSVVAEIQANLDPYELSSDQTFNSTYRLWKRDQRSSVTIKDLINYSQKVLNSKEKESTQIKNVIKDNFKLLKKLDALVDADQLHVNAKDVNKKLNDLKQDLHGLKVSHDGFKNKLEEIEDMRARLNQLSSHPDYAEVLVKLPKLKKVADAIYMELRIQHAQNKIEQMQEENKSLSKNRNENIEAIGARLNIDFDKRRAGLFSSREIISSDLAAEEYKFARAVHKWISNPDDYATTLGLANAMYRISKLNGNVSPGVKELKTLCEKRKKHGIPNAIEYVNQHLADLTTVKTNNALLELYKVKERKIAEWQKADSVKERRKIEKEINEISDQINQVSGE